MENRNKTDDTPGTYLFVSEQAVRQVQARVSKSNHLARAVQAPFPQRVGVADCRLHGRGRVVVERLRLVDQIHRAHIRVQGQRGHERREAFGCVAPVLRGLVNAGDAHVSPGYGNSRSQLVEVARPRREAWIQAVHGSLQQLPHGSVAQVIRCALDHVPPNRGHLPRHPHALPVRLRSLPQRNPNRVGHLLQANFLLCLAGLRDRVQRLHDDRRQLQQMRHAIHGDVAICLQRPQHFQFRRAAQHDGALLVIHGRDPHLPASQAHHSLRVRCCRAQLRESAAVRRVF